MRRMNKTPGRLKCIFAGITARLPRELSLVSVDCMPLSHYPDTSLHISVFLVIEAEMILRITTFK